MNVLEPNASSRVLHLPIIADFRQCAFVASMSLKSQRKTNGHYRCAYHPACRDHCRETYLLVPRLLNYIVAIYLIFVGVMGLNGVHHWLNFH